MHKRAVSAPNIVSNLRVHPNIILFPSEPTPVFPSHPETPPPMMRSPSDACTPANGSTSSGAGPKCLYVDDCDTKSVPRKAISHIFGRNKLCTRQIPDEVWVHFCRKHYQRGRYRNTTEYAKIQCELVVTQIGWIHKWSEKNKAEGAPGVVKDWSLCLRKREKDRLQMKKARQTTQYKDESDNEDAEDSNDQSVVNGWNVPSWLRKKCQDGYSTEEIEEIARRILKEVSERTLRQIPDVEFLPNVSTGASDGAKHKISCKRKTDDAIPHRRSQSEGSLGSSGYSSSTTQLRSRLVPYQLSYPDDRLPSTTNKRRRRENLESYQQHFNGPAAMHPMESLPFRPYENATAHLQTNHADRIPFNNTMGQNQGGRNIHDNPHYSPSMYGGVFHDDVSQSNMTYNSIGYDGSPSSGISYNGSSHSAAGGYNEGPLPVPASHRIPSNMLSASHDALSVPSNGRPSHHRSLSELPRPPYQQSDVQPDRSSASSYSGTLSLPPMAMWDFAPPRPSAGWPVPSSGPNCQLPILGSSSKHARHQSTPIAAPSNIPRSPAPMYNQAEARYRVGVGDYVYETSSASGYSISGQLTPAQSTHSQSTLSRSPSASTHSSGHRPYHSAGPSPRESEEYYRVMSDAGERRV